MLHVPLSFRALIAFRILRTAAQHQNTLSQTSKAASESCRADGCSLLTNLNKRLYATVHGDSTDEVWREHSDAIFRVANNKVPKQPPKQYRRRDDPIVFLKRRISVLPPSEERELATALLEDSKTRTRHGTRARLRQKILEALDTKIPLNSLRRLAHIHKIPNSLTLCSESEGSSSAQRLDSDVQSKDGKVEEQSQSSNHTEQIQLLDVAYVQRTMPLPSPDQYPDALSELFDPVRVVVAINNQCSKRKFSQNIDVDMTPKTGLSAAARRSLSPGGSPIMCCTLKLEITEFCTVTALGEGLSKQAARHAAWMHLVSKMHVDGTLKELFAPTKTSPSLSDPPEGSDLDLEPVEIDANIKHEEKDAKVEIYDYAASLGLVPTFEISIVKTRPMRARPGYNIKPVQNFSRARIRLEARSIDVSAVGKDVNSAEVAAALAFKAEAEKQFVGLQNSTASEKKAILTVDNAKMFFEFYKTRSGNLNVAVEHESKYRNGINHNIARIIINGSPAGKEVTMQKKTEAKSVAYLTAAVEITNSNPRLLREFEATMTEGRGKVVRPVKPVSLLLNSEVASTMREGLLEARSAGLSDTRRTLGAEAPDSDQKIYQHRPRLSSEEKSRLSKRLLTGQEHLLRHPAFEELRSKRAALPMSQYRDQVLSMVSENPYCIVVGATGSGKTTQVPQILFEQATIASEGASCNIICTQPRRIAATSVARRVSAERDERLRDTVGYQVRFDSKLPRYPFGITYCTTGVLLEKIKHDPEEVFDTTSHICIDEVHERDLQIDFLMIVLKRAIKARQAENKAVPKIILMSATLDTEMFAKYFSIGSDDGKSLPCPVLTVPGRTFPVQEKFLGSIMDEMQGSYGAELSNLLKLHAFTEDYLKVEDTFTASERRKHPDGRKKGVIDWKREWQESAEPEEVNEKEESLVPVSLMMATVTHICKTTEDGAILAFLPGIGEILEVEKLLLTSNPFGVNFNDTEKYRIFPLHSSSTPDQQASIFDALPPGCRKIILATNIAETSVTVTDVKYVVDSGKLRELRYDQLRRITKLQCVWVSKSNAKQRAGRAGRVQNGYYYALYSQERSQSLKAIGQPELLRSDLQETSLAIVAQHFSEPVGSFLAQAIEPPKPQAVHSAVGNLIDIEALTPDESITALGRVLSKLPVHPSLGKMIILGVIFRCLDPMIILGAAVDERPLFTRPIGMRELISQAHGAYAPDEQSDQLALIEAFQELRMLRNQYGDDEARQRATENFLHWGAFRTIDSTTKQIEDVLVECGLIAGTEMEAQSVIPACGPVALNRNSQNPALIKSLIIAGLSSNIGVKTSQMGHTYRTAKDDWVTMHPTSRNADSKAKQTKHDAGDIFTYRTLAKSIETDSLFLRDTTKVTPLQTLLFGGQLRLLGAYGKIEMDEWLPFNVRHSDPQFAARLLLEFRKALDRVLFRAFEGLEDFGAEKGGMFADDPVRENFVRRVVQIVSAKDRSAEEALKEWKSLLLKEEGI